MCLLRTVFYASKVLQVKWWLIIISDEVLHASVGFYSYTLYHVITASLIILLYKQLLFFFFFYQIPSLSLSF